MLRELCREENSLKKKNKLYGEIKITTYHKGRVAPLQQETNKKEINKTLRLFYVPPKLSLAKLIYLLTQSISIYFYRSYPKD